MLIDTHAHLNFGELKSKIEDVLTRAGQAGVEKIINVGTDIAESKGALELADKYPNCFATVGIHPTDSPIEGEWEEEFRKLCTEPKVVAVGECGLDIFTKDTSRGVTTREKEKREQIDLFERQLHLAKDLAKPVVVHCRGGWNDIFDIIKNFKVRGIFHSWTGSRKDLDRALSLGFSISFSGIVTFKNAREIAYSAQEVPPDRFVLETDSPFLSPEPLRGNTNEPANVKIIAEFIAGLRNTDFEDISFQTSMNAKKIFSL